MNARRFAKYSFISLGVLAVAAAITIVFVIPSIDADAYRPIIENSARALTGRDLHIDGPLRLRMTTRMSIVASDVRLTNVAWGTHPDMLRIDRLDAAVTLLPLLRGVVRIERLSLHGPRVFLETDAAGDGNWKFAPEAHAEAITPWKLEIALDAVSLADAHIEFRDGKAAHRYRLSLAQLTAHRTGADAVVLNGRGMFGESALSLRMGVGSAGGVFTPRSRVELTVDMTLGTMSIAANGAVEDLFAISDVELLLSVKGNDLAVVVRDLGWDLPAIGPYEIAGRLSGSRQHLRLHDIRFTAGREDTVVMSVTGQVGDIIQGSGALFDIDARIAQPERWAIGLGEAAAWLPAMRITGRLTPQRGALTATRLVLTLGRTSMSGEARLDLHQGPPRISAKMRGATVDLSQLPANKTAPLKTLLARDLRSAQPLNVDWMRKFDADLELAADAIQLSGKHSLFRPYARLLLRDGQLTLAPVRVQLAPQSPPLSGRLAVQNTSIGVRVTADIAGASIGLSDVLAIVGSPTEMEGAPTQIDIALKSTGHSPRELLGGLNGDAKVIVGGGQFPSNKVDFGARLLTRLLGMTQSSEERRAELMCGAVYLPIRNGTVTLDRNAALHTSNVVIVASGVVDLTSEVMEMFVYTRATEGLGLEAGRLTNMFKIQGTLAKPSVSVNPKGVVRGGLSLGAAAVTGGASLLFEGLAEKAAADPDPCGAALTLRSKR